jgi:acyl-CoA thioesterase
VRGRVFSRDGRLVASTAQEGLIRKRTKAGARP